MDEIKYPLLISERESREWIKTCPMQVKKIRVTKETEASAPQITVFTSKCGDYTVDKCIVSIEIMNDRREIIGKLENISIQDGESSPINSENEKTTYAYAIIEEVVYNGNTWKNTSGNRGDKIPEQDVFWQTDPLYDQIKRECVGVVDAKYKPDRIDGAWRCACGQINLESSEKCGSCGCSLEWLNTHLERTYLEEQKKISDTKTERELVKEKKRKSRQPSDKTKAILILASFVVVVALVICTFTVFIPLIRYNNANSLVNEGEYDRAIEVFRDLGDFKDSASRANEANYKKAQELTGLEEVNMTTTARSPWFKITEDGVLSFIKDEYDDVGGSWNHFVVPDMVDNIIVRELDRNFFINCKELTVVTISDCVEVIGEQAFMNCEMLHTVNFGKNIKTLGARVFIDCFALEEVTIPDTVESLGARAFNNCVALKKVVLGKGITKILDYTFSFCRELESITLCSPITSIGEFAFSECASLGKIFCRFTESEWIEPEVAAENDVFNSVKLSFNN